MAEDEIEERIEQPISAEAEHEVTAHARAGRRADADQRAGRGNRKLRALIERANRDLQLKAWWHVATSTRSRAWRSTTTRGCTSRSSRTSRSSSCASSRSTTSSRRWSRDYGMTHEDAEVVVALGGLLHCVGMSVHRDHHEDFSLVLAAPKLQELLDGLYDEPEKTVIASEVLQVITATAPTAGR